MISLLVLSCVVTLGMARPEPPVYPEDYSEQEYFTGGGGGGPVGTKTIVVLKGPGGGDSYSGGGSFTGGGSVGGYGGNHDCGGTGLGGGYGQGGYEQEAVVQKHIYVHLPPPEPEIAAPPKVIPPPPPKKHYKIVFIKAPSSPSQAPPVIPPPQQDQEKTLIYVLHKNPADAAPIVIPTAPPTPPSKPEVYFIRYKTQKEISPTFSTGGYGSTTLGPHYSSTFSPVSSTFDSLGHLGSTAVSIVPRPTAYPTVSYSTTSNYH